MDEHDRKRGMKVAKKRWKKMTGKCRQKRQEKEDENARKVEENYRKRWTKIP